MRVAILARDYPPAWGGLSTYADGLASELKEQGVDVEVLVGRTNLRTLLLPLWAGLGSFDVVHAMSPPYAAFVRHPRLVITVAEPASTERVYYGAANRLRALPARLLEKSALKRAKCVVALSETTKKKLLDLLHVKSESIKVIPAGINLSEFTPRDKALNPPRILMVSRLDRRKNIPEALEGLSALKGQRFECVIAGDGPERSRLGLLAKSMDLPVTFAGAVADELLREYCATSPIFVTSSSSEGFGLSLLQAMASGCAVVASDIGAHRELVKDGVDGLLYSGAKDLGSKLTMLLWDPPFSSKLGTNARESAMAYSWNESASKIRAVYEEMSRA